MNAVRSSAIVIDEKAVMIKTAAAISIFSSKGFLFIVVGLPVVKTS